MLKACLGAKSRSWLWAHFLREEVRIMEPLIAMGAGGIISICLVFGYWGLAEEKPRKALRWYKAANTIAAVVLFIILRFFSSRDENDPVTAFCLMLFIGCATVATASLIFTIRPNNDHNSQDS